VQCEKTWDPPLEKLYSLKKRNEIIMNDIQYVYDAGGNKKSVIVPIELWERTLQVHKPGHIPCNPQEYYGIYQDRILDPQAEAQALRNEWNRI
jgi:hypothetical protein